MGCLCDGDRGVLAAERAARGAQLASAALTTDSSRGASEPLANPRPSGGRPRRPPDASPFRVALGQLREVFDPPGAACGERDDRPERQLLEVLDREIRQFHGHLKVRGSRIRDAAARRAAEVRFVPGKEKGDMLHRLFAVENE